MQFSGVILRLFAMLALAIPSTTHAAWGGKKAAEAVLLKEVTALTFQKGAYTTGRRSAPIPQLSCMGGDCSNSPSSVLCRNVGFDGTDVQWECKADVPNGRKLGRVEVICEGYDNPNDPYILKGSCGLEFEIEGGSTQQQTYQSQSQNYHHSSGNYHTPRSDSSWSFGSVVMLLIVGVVVYSIYKTCAAGVSGIGGGGGGGYGGGPGPGFRGNVYGAPPSYEASCGAGGMGYGAPGMGMGMGMGMGAGGMGGGFRPGFWSGAGLGGLAGYFAGRRSTNAYTPTYAHTYAAPSFSSASAPPPTHSTSYGGTRRR